MNPPASTARIAFVFPGQGSQSIGMMSALAAEHPEVSARFATSSAVLGFDLWDLVCAGPEDRLNRTQVAQPAMLAAGVATWDVWRKIGGPLPASMAGHSFGEYTALVCAGSLDFETAVGLVADRARYMQEAVPEGEGAMAAVLGLELEAIEHICAQAAGREAVCAAANLNAPGQIVIAGNSAAVGVACGLALEAGAKRTIPLTLSVPVHCDLMRPAAERLAERLQSVELEPPMLDVIHNFDVAAHCDPAQIRDVLVSQLYSPVRWMETIGHFARDGVSQLFECGPGKVLSSLIKRIDRSLVCTPLTDWASIRAGVATATGEMP